ncbi:hypothetical protein XELAEV_18044121mg [Xenopus laevis]|uniref:Uncharacterized protein n=1 Tax=Xenopus laevis TaxID=8355 RepID=A0A974BYH5_XENLA|nr:hypothetical protein XELAEV_18044121mg [Xenopus laevis]
MSEILSLWNTSIGSHTAKLCSWLGTFKNTDIRVACQLVYWSWFTNSVLHCAQMTSDLVYDGVSVACESARSPLD